MSFFLKGKETKMTDRLRNDPGLNAAIDDAFLNITTSAQNSTTPTLADERLAWELAGMGGGAVLYGGGAIAGRYVGPKVHPEVQKAMEAKAKAQKAFDEAKAKRASMTASIDEKVKAAQERVNEANKKLKAAQKIKNPETKAANVERAQTELTKANESLEKAKAELQKKTDTSAYKKALEAEEAAKKTNSAAQRKLTNLSKKYPNVPSTGAKWISGGLKCAGVAAAVISGGLFVHHLTDYMFGDTTFYNTDAQGKKVICDPKVLTATSNSDEAKQLFSGTPGAVCVLMASYAAKNGLGSIPKEEWQDYFAHMGTGEKFTLDSEVKLRQTLLRAYQKLSVEEKIKHIDALIAENADNQELVAGLTKLKTDIQAVEGNANNGRGTSSKDHSGETTPTPAPAPTPTPTPTPTPKPGRKKRTKKGSYKAPEGTPSSKSEKTKRERKGSAGSERSGQTSTYSTDSNATSALASVSTNITAGTREQDASRDYGSGRGDA